MAVRLVCDLSVGKPPPTMAVSMRVLLLAILALLTANFADLVSAVRPGLVPVQ